VFATSAHIPNNHRFDAFRSIFPAGTVSGAPKIKAIELIHGLEKERRGVYAGAVGRFDFADDEMDTCIAIRTMTFKDGVAYLQAGGGIVYDSVEDDEYTETVNKLMGNLRALEQAESRLRLLTLGENRAHHGCRILAFYAEQQRQRSFSVASTGVKTHHVNYYCIYGIECTKAGTFD
jgi:hypothetical protein